MQNVPPRRPSSWDGSTGTANHPIPLRALEGRPLRPVSSQRSFLLDYPDMLSRMSVGRLFLAPSTYLPTLVEDQSLGARAVCVPLFEDDHALRVIDERSAPCPVATRGSLRLNELFRFITQDSTSGRGCKRDYCGTWCHLSTRLLMPSVISTFFTQLGKS